MSDSESVRAVLGLAQMYKTLGTAAQQADAQLIGDAIRARFNAAIGEEREACAKVIEVHTPHPGTGWRERLAAKIRARGDQ